MLPAESLLKPLSVRQRRNGQATQTNSGDPYNRRSGHRPIPSKNISTYTSQHEVSLHGTIGLLTASFVLGKITFKLTEINKADHNTHTLPEMLTQDGSKFTMCGKIKVDNLPVSPAGAGSRGFANRKGADRSIKRST